MKDFSNILILILLFELGCSNKNNHQIIKTKQGDCIFIETFEDTLNKYYCKQYYESGKLYREGNYVDSIAIDWHKFYYPDGQIKMEIEYVWLTEDSISRVNQIIRFNEKGDTIKNRSNYFKIIATKDTINLGDTFYARLILETPYWDTSNVIFWFDVPNDSSLLRRMISDNHQILYDYCPKDTGLFLMSGHIAEFMTFDSLVGKDSIEQFEKVRIMYFDKNYYVKNK